MSVVEKVLVIDSDLQKDIPIDATVQIGNMVINSDLNTGMGGTLPYYKGLYEATPKAYDETILPTKNKSMKDDVKVLVIPTEEVSNLYGTTFAIAREGIELSYG